MQKERTASIVVVGATGVGKSSLIGRYVTDEYVQCYEPSLEDSYAADLIVDGARYTTNVYDSAFATLDLLHIPRTPSSQCMAFPKLRREAQPLTILPPPHVPAPVDQAQATQKSRKGPEGRVPAVVQATTTGNKPRSTTVGPGSITKEMLEKLGGPAPDQTELNLQNMVLSPHLRLGQGFLAVFDVADSRSFYACAGIVRAISEVRGESHFPLVLVGTKSDLEARRQIGHHQALKLSREWWTIVRGIPPDPGQDDDVPYIETSAFNGTNCEQAFISLVRRIQHSEDARDEILRRATYVQPEVTQTQKMARETEKKKKKGCYIM